MRNVKSFEQYLVEEVKEVFFTFGRMNPPTTGHQKLLDALSTKAGRNPYMVFLSQSTDPKKNPLSYQQKVKHARKMFPKHGRSIILNKKIRTAFDAVTLLYGQGYNRLNMVVGSDRVAEFETLLNKYNGKEGRHGFYNFESIKVHSAGARDPDADDVSGMSASKQRENAKNNDFSTFSQGIPSNVSTKDAKRLFNDIRVGMGLKESVEFKNHVELEPVSKIREKYIGGDLFNEGQRVVIKSNNKEGYVHRLGTNYLIVALDEGRISRQWIDNVEQIEESTPTLVYIKKGKLDKSKVKILKQQKAQGQHFVQVEVGGKKKWWKIKHKAGTVEAESAGGRRDVRVGEFISIEEKTDRWYKDQPEWGTPEATKKAKDKTPGQTKESSKVKRAKKLVFNPVAKHARTFNKATVQRDRKKDQKKGKTKHKLKLFEKE